MKLNNNIQVYCKSMGKIFPITHIAKTADEANAFCGKHKDAAVIAEDRKSGLVFIASKYAMTTPSSALPDVKSDEAITPVIFRVFKDGGDVIALFPTMPGTNDKRTVLSYQHVGQHGASDYAIVSDGQTRAALPEEYVTLKKELEGIGYVLKVCKRMSRALRAELEENWRICRG